jgi:hypothetical protein
LWYFEPTAEITWIAGAIRPAEVALILRRATVFLRTFAELSRRMLRAWLALLAGFPG